MTTESANVESANAEALLAALQAELRKAFQPGESVIKISTAAEREDVSLATAWNNVRTDPNYPKTLHDSRGMARLIERQHNAYMAWKWAAMPKNRAYRARIHRKAA